ncbi:MAG TPA: diguanylate cyclase, partial [Verrucomicrobiae bacterium]|nr:diguanylate cyclase [Verrucomicrobiae bacterium]
YPQADILGTDIRRLFTEEAAADFSEITSELHGVRHHVTEMLCRNGERGAVSLALFPLLEGEEPVGVLTLARDVSREKSLETALREKEERFRSAFESAAIGMAIVSLDGRFADVNASLCEMTGYEKDELLALTFQELTHPEDLDADLALVQMLLAGERRSYHLEKRYFHRSGRLVYVLLSVSLLRDAAGLPLYFISQIQDVTERRRAEELLLEAKKEAEEARRVAEMLAATDYLTGLLNRRAFTERLDAELARRGREAAAISVIIADIDDFKKINDSYGHAVGDTVLKEFARALRSSSRMYDFAGRYGGEEFVVALPGTQREEAVLVAERMRQEVMACTVMLDGRPSGIRITASFGVATCTGGVGAGCSDQMVRAADGAMYAAKRAGKNRVCSTEELVHCGDPSAIPKPNCLWYEPEKDRRAG